MDQKCGNPEVTGSKLLSIRDIENNDIRKAKSKVKSEKLQQQMGAGRSPNVGTAEQFTNPGNAHHMVRHQVNVES